jgi:hypothetical protein
MRSSCPAGSLPISTRRVAGSVANVPGASWFAATCVSWTPSRNTWSGFAAIGNDGDTKRGLSADPPITEEGKKDHAVLQACPERCHEVTGTEPSNQTASFG